MNESTELPGRDGPRRSAGAGFDVEERAMRRGNGHGGDSVPALLRQLVEDVATLFRKELALAASEINHSITDARRGVGGLATGGAILYAGLLFLLGAAVSGLAQVMPTWAALLVVGAVAAIVGFVLLKAGQKKLSARNLTPGRTAESLRRDRQTLRRQVS